ncbi:MAG: hypothetical protein ACM3UL_00870 [Ignavibacteria bacterium]
MGKLGRKVCCEFDKNVKCILLIKGRKRCVFDETTKEQHERGERQLGVCALLPQSERESFLLAMKKEGLSNFRSWKDKDESPNQSP